MECPLHQLALRHPDHPLIEFDGGMITAWQAERFVQGLTHHLFNWQGQPVHLRCPHHEKTLLVFVALYRLGAKIILIHPKDPIQSPHLIDPISCSLDGFTTSKPIILKHAVSLILFPTSGSTQAPKLIAHTLKTLSASAASSASYYQLEGKKFHLSLPLNHVGGMMIFFRMVVGQGTVVLNPHSRCDFYSFVPTQLHRLLKAGISPNSPYRQATLLIGGAPISEDLITSSLREALRLSCTYGMTETASQITAGSFSCGHPLPGKELKIGQDQGIYVKANSLFVGYGLDQSPVPLTDGYFATRDLGTYDPDHGLIVIGRKDRVIIKGGENIHPEILEELILAHQAVESATCVGVEDEEYGQLIACFISPYDPSIFEEVNRSILHRLGPYFLINHFHPAPVTLGLKPRFKELQLAANARIKREKIL
jgi:acyl-CoA synthetase (AMP-forming)/AMP-acid ligase II